MREDAHRFTGLRRDVHQINQKAEFLWDAHNIRLTNRDDSTLLSITNERGPSPTGITCGGKYVGHCILGKYLIVFTRNGDNSEIYKITDNGNNYDIDLLFSEDMGNEGWSTENPIETLGYYENELVQKVYWIDGVHQPRVINIMKEGGYQSTDFDFVQILKLEEEVSIEEIRGNGLFASGVIQYAFSYYNKFGQETNLFYISPLQYITYPDRGGSPEDRISTSFKITIDKVEDKYDYIRVYSIHRTSLDSEPTVKIVSDIEINDTTVEIIDTGTIGEVTDPNYLMYIGGREIVPHCMTQKDGVLFFGNIELKEDDKFLEFKERSKVRNAVTIQTGHQDGLFSEYDNPNGTYYSYKINPGVRGFKSNETYRVGIQFQKNNGNWTEPIYITDTVLNHRVPYVSNTTVRWDASKIILSPSFAQEAINNNYLKARACIVFPNISDRTVICQGVLCPTVGSNISRAKNSPYVQSSWFFRAALPSAPFDPSSSLTGSNIQYAHNKLLFGNGERGGEVQGTLSYGRDHTDISGATLMDKTYFFVDENIVTMHSPDIEFDTSINFLDEYSDYKLHILGFIELEAISGDISLQTSTPSAGDKAGGLVTSFQGYQVNQQSWKNGGLVTGLYNDAVVKNDFTVSDSYTDYIVYPWNRSGSLNNDVVRPSDKGTRTAILSKKVISNLKYFLKYTPLENTTVFTIKNPQLFSAETLDIKKVWCHYLKKEVTYMGNIDTLVSSKEEYQVFNDSSVTDFSVMVNSKEPVRIKYKSTPHLVFSLGSGNPDDDTVYLPPVSENTLYPVQDEYQIPEWDESAKTPETNSWENALEVCYIGRPVAQKLFTTGKYVMDISTGRYTEMHWIESVTYPPYYKVNDAQDRKNIVIGAIIRIKGDGSVITQEGNGIAEPVETIRQVASVTGDNIRIGAYKGDDIYLQIDAVHYASRNNPVTVVSYKNFTIPDNTEDIPTRGEEDSKFQVHRDIISTSVFNSKNPYLCLAELRREVPDNIRFGGDSDYVLKSHLWYPVSDIVSLEGHTTESIEIPLLYGDTWYQRYDCLKTYPFTREDENQIVEIGSFMCETRVNIDGRYDRNRGQISNLDMSPLNFNLINPVYTQRDNFFRYQILDESMYKNSIYGNQITWSQIKTSDIFTDIWTNVTLANILDINGDKGNVTSLKVFNDILVCFQEKAVNQILFNSRVQITPTDGVPIEIANNGKVDGYRVLSDKVGCQNKWSVCNAATGLYFIDNYSDSIWQTDGQQLQSLTELCSMQWWAKAHHSSKEWNPEFTVGNNVRTFYDSIHKDIYFVPGLQNSIENDALCYSEQLGQFVSQYSYGGLQSMDTFNDDFISLRTEDNEVQLYKNFKGTYNKFFDNYRQWDISFISNDVPTMTKIFDTIELRTDHTSIRLGEVLNTCPINFIQANNEYQDTKVVDYTKSAFNFRKKFRVWRGIIPRNVGTRQRIRNPWSLIKLGHMPEGTDDLDSNKAVIHDISVKYTL